MLPTLYKSFLIILLYLTISMKNAKLHAEKDEGLICTRDLPRLVYDVAKFAKYGYPRLRSPTAIACSIKSPKEQAFNDQYSLGKNSLFVRATYEAFQPSKYVAYQICETPYKMSVVYHRIEEELQFGFEIYYNKSEFRDKNFVDSKKWHYDLITNTHSKKNYIMPFLSRVPSIPPAIGNLIPTPVTSAFSKISQDSKMYLDDQTEMGFIWATAFHLKFTFGSKRLAQAVYNLSQSTRGVHECNDWNLGIEYFTAIGIPIDKLYSEDNQRRMLKGVKIPTSKPQNENEDHEDASCESENQCFVKWSALPAEKFHFLAAKPTSCSYLAAVPIWKSTIENILKKLDNFLHTISQAIDPSMGAIGIHSGVHGELQLPTDSDTKQPRKTITLTENSIPVPDVIYKLIKYKPTLCEEDDDEDNKVKDDDKNREVEPKDDAKKDELNKDKPVDEKHKGNDDDKSNIPKEGSTVEGGKKPACISIQTAIIVVIHNNPNFNPDTEKICEDKCSKWRWEEIQFREVAGKRFKSKYIYCCDASNVNVRNKLGISNDNYVEKSLEFALNAVYLPHNEIMNLRPYDISDTIIKDYKKLFERDESKPNENNEENLEIKKIDLVRPEFFEISEPEHGKDEPEKSETELVDDETVIEGSPAQEDRLK